MSGPADALNLRLAISQRARGVLARNGAILPCKAILGEAFLSFIYSPRGGGPRDRTKRRNMIANRQKI